MLKINISTEKSLAEILTWLQVENIESNDGFFCNKNILLDSHAANEVYCAHFDNNAVGFIIHNKKSSGASIDILEVNPNYRRRRFGTELATHAIHRLFDSDAEFITVKCSPRSSETFWRTLGFIPEDSPYAKAGEPFQMILHNLSYNSQHISPLTGF